MYLFICDPKTNVSNHEIQNENPKSNHASDDLVNILKWNTECCNHVPNTFLNGTLKHFQGFHWTSDNSQNKLPFSSHTVLIQNTLKWTHQFFECNLENILKSFGDLNNKISNYFVNSPDRPIKAARDRWNLYISDHSNDGNRDCIDLCVFHTWIVHWIAQLEADRSRPFNTMVPFPRSYDWNYHFDSNEILGIKTAGNFDSGLIPTTLLAWAVLGFLQATPSTFAALKCPKQFSDTSHKRLVIVSNG